MSSNKAARAVRRHVDSLAVASQLRIYKHDKTNTAVKTPGRYRKQHATNCGRSHCMLCVNPRRTWGRLTLAEISANEALGYELQNL